MNENVEIPLLQYKNILEWKPKVGDVIIKHGVIRRTVWFGVVNNLTAEGFVDIAKAGMLQLLTSMDPDQRKKTSVKIHVSEINRSRGGYSIQQHDKANTSIWYI
jgi:hypothetical protein